jgi:uncharacterized protein (DUF1330 family)
MSCYFIANIAIRDHEEYQKYLDGFDAAFGKHCGEVIAVDDQPSILEGEWPYTRVVLIRFPDQKAAMSWYQSAEYQALARHRRRASLADIILAEGRL